MASIVLGAGEERRVALTLTGGEAIHIPSTDPSARGAEQEPPKGGRGKRIGGLVTMAAGVGLASAALFFALEARSASDDVNRFLRDRCAPGAGACDWGAVQARDAEGQSAQTKAIVLSSIGGAALFGGAILYYLGWRQKEAAPSPVSVGLRERGGTLLWQGRF
jgi:hypothetical protein